MPRLSRAPHLPRIPLSFSLALSLLLALAAAPAPAHAQGTLTLRLEDYAAAPITGQFVGSTDNSIYAARINFLREEPGGHATRLWVNDLNGKLYLLDKATKQFAPYLDFHRNTSENSSATGLFPAFTRANGYANGFVTFQFDPEYATAGSPHRGKFYTVHIEIDTNDGDARRIPNASSFPGYANAAAYAPTIALEAPGTDNANTRHAVLIEWQDIDPADAIFQGTARELLRLEFNGRIHPLGDIAFNPRATSPDDPDYRAMYLAVGDGGAGEQNNEILHATPQRVDVLQGKILRISPDDPDGPGPLRYGIPVRNPFTVSTAPANSRPEIWAYGFRNPHRLAFDPLTGTLLAADIGFHSWEEVNIVHKAGNYGWGEREGTFVLDVRTGLASTPRPPDDSRRNFLYPVLQYPHSPALGVGDAVAGGFVYRGARLPQLRGKYVFGDITTGELFYSDLVEMISADDGNPATLAPIHHLDVLWDNPRNAAGPERFDRLYEIVQDEYRARGGRDTDLPGSATVSDLTGGGRADIRIVTDHAGELYVLSKSDGMIRALTAVATPAAAPTFVTQPQSATVAAYSTAFLTAAATGGVMRYQWLRNGTPIPGATTALLRLPEISDSATFHVDAINLAGITRSQPAQLTVINAPSTRLANLAIRSAAGTGAQTLIAGFALGGPRTGAPSLNHDLLLRGVGPSLSRFGVTSFLPDPVVSLYRGSVLLASNDNWSASPVFDPDGISPAFGAFALTGGSRDALLRLSRYDLGAYSMQISSAAAGQTGIALAEIFDSPNALADLSARQLVNLSARTQVGTGENLLIAGFTLAGAAARTVLLRAAGPALTQFNVPGALANPKLTLFRDTTPIAENDNWQTSPELVDLMRAAGAFDFVARSRDAVLLTTLPPGNYTVQVSGTNNTTGVALVEVYTLP